jgi:hypothetical protein
MERNVSERRKVEERIKKKEAEIQELERQVGEARVYLQALQDVLKLFPREAGSSSALAVAALRPGSAVGQARDIILRHGAPVHITEILKELGKEVTRETRASLAGSLAAYVRRGEIFTRPAPNHFGLVEFGGTPPVDTPPDDFGAIASQDDDIPF